MKMFKKIMAVALTAVMAVSMLTGCAIGDAFHEKQLLNALNDAGTTTKVIGAFHKYVRTTRSLLAVSSISCLRRLLQLLRRWLLPRPLRISLLMPVALLTSLIASLPKASMLLLQLSFLPAVITSGTSWLVM